MSETFENLSNINSIKDIVFSFKGLKHRLERVRKVGGVTFYNDSFSTNSETTMAAITSFDEPLTLIMGGSDKGLEYDNLARSIKRSINVKLIVLIGEISNVLNDTLESVDYTGRIMKLGSKDISNIVKIAHKETPKGGVVLLSPATASFDMFDNYKDRGNKFKDAVNNL